MDQPDILKDFYVYEDDFVKGFIHIQEAQVVELYVDTFFVDRGIGAKLLDFAINSRNCNSLWVLEKNTKARCFYLRHGFTPSGKKQLENGTEQYIIEMIR
ncbi:MAG: GNAT family N-acetyltransferase [Lachnospiraceae bacterium]|nr:GNAT family N-acetyltransferase [Lachnospiraceae bacterium]